MVHQLTIGKRITVLRKQLNITQKDLGAMFGVTPQSISKWENGSSLPNIVTLSVLCKIFFTDLNTLISDDFIHLNEKSKPITHYPLRKLENTNVHNLTQFTSNKLLYRVDINNLQANEAPLIDCTFSECAFRNLSHQKNQSRNIRFINCRFESTVDCSNSIADNQYLRNNFIAGNYENCNFAHTSYDHETINGANFKGIHFTSSTCTDSYFEKVNLTSAVFKDHIFYRTTMKNCNLTNITFQDCQFYETTFENCTFDKKTFNFLATNGYAKILSPKIV
ncbi:MAG: helix-turn-helix domain-containing protein [Mycoplasmataceae bacterium]|nr:helix-turn-helix domain-containing protein [Mycoplasmataceae bacterium]